VEAFDYAAIDAKGIRQRGTVMASSSRDARDMLRARALTPIDLNRSRKKTAQTSDASNGLFSGRIKLKDLTRATRQLAILIGAATPVEDALRVIALQFEKSPMRGVLLSIRGQVMEGLKLSDAMRSQPQAFDDLYIAMVTSGEIAILMVLVIPKVVAQFDSFGQDLPPLTKFVISFSEGFQAYGLWVGIALCFMFFGFKFLLTRPAIRFAWDKMKLGLPLLGNIIRDLNAARFSRTMAGLVSAGTPALAALETSRHTLKNVVMRDAIIGAASRVREGSPISRALESTEVFPPLVTQMVAGGEASGDTGDMFSRSADYLENEFEAKTSVFLTLLEPLIIIFLAGVVLVIIAAIFLPILTLNTFIL